MEWQDKGFHERYLNNIKTKTCSIGFKSSLKSLDCESRSIKAVLFYENVSNERKGIWGFIKRNKQVIYELHGDHDPVWYVISLFCLTQILCTDGQLWVDNAPPEWGEAACKK